MSSFSFNPALSLSLCMLLTAGFCSPAMADDLGAFPATTTSPNSAGAGLALRLSASPYLGGSTRIDFMPLYSYDGERLFLQANRAGFKLLDENNAQGGQRLHVFVEQRLEGFAVARLPAGLQGMAARDVSTDIGASYRLQQSWGTLRAEVFKGVGNAVRGSEARLGYSNEWRSGSWSVRPDVSVSWRDAKLNNYYYGVMPSEAITGRPAYAPGAGFQSQLGLFASYDMTQRWRFLTGASLTLLGSSVKESPIVQKRMVPAVYVGASYDFGGPQVKSANSANSAQSESPAYIKVLYGMATENSCHLARIITARCLSTAKLNATSVVGVQIGKPFIEKLNGWPLDFVGYVGLTHHNEHGLQANGTQLDVFMKGFYYGFPWSDRVKTRLGWGLGLSTAQRVPYTEVISQKDKTTSRLLNYMDPTIDVSVGDLFGSRRLKDTFVGIGVSHRSGIFGASRLLGSVSGGSNYIYTYVETAF